MEDKGLKISIEKPLKLEPHQEWICNYLDRLNEKEKICAEGILPSDLIKGALAVVLNKELNPDWMAQSAHSYRELLYGLGGKKDQSFYFKIKFKFYFWLNKLGIKNKTVSKVINSQSTKRQNIENILQILHEQKRAQVIAGTLYKTHLAFTKISHHFVQKNSRKEAIRIFIQLGIKIEENSFPSIRDFNSLIQVFENTLKESSLDPLKIHEKIDSFLKENNKDASYLRLLFSLNYDAKRYYFSKADKSWLTWIWQEGFLDEIKNKAEDPTRYVNRMPELDYLTKIAEKDPVKVSEIILDKETATKEEKFNPEVIDRFLWIISTLPAEQIKTLTAKIRDEKWVYSMRSFRKTGYEFEKIIKKLAEKKEGNAILELAQALLIAADKNKNPERVNSFGTPDPFYVSDLDASGIFEALSDIEESYLEKALQITTSILAEIVKLAEPDDTKVFDYTDLFALYDVDLFTLEIENKRSYSYREDIKNLTATIKKLIERSIGKKCDNVKEVKRLFEYINNLPSCHSMWRLRLFTLTQCPEVFKEELKNAFFKLFEVDNYYEIEGGTEYKKALKIAFPYLSDTDQRAYVAKVLKYFSEKAIKDPDQVWHKRIGWEILSSISKYLKDDELKKCEEIFGSECDEKYEPKPSIGEMQSGYVNHRSPINLDNFTIDQIIKNLKSEWTAENLNEQFKNDDFLNPRGVEGLGDALKEDIKKRTNDYLKNIDAFFDRNNIHSHYLYSLLRGLEEMLRNKQSLSPEQIDKIFGLFKIIRISGSDPIMPFKRKKDDKSWLADWIEVHKVITDILLHILENREIKEAVHKSYREEIKNLIAYLFTIKDSPSKENEKPEYGEPYHIAINSVRGRAYEAFVMFTENDGKILAEDIKNIYKETLSDDSLAVRFVIGRYLAFFYFRGKDFIVNLFPEIFPKNDPNKKDLYLATWEGYLSNTLYDKLFIALNDYYSYAITLTPKDYTQRKYLKGLDESLAIHLALAFAHLGLEINNPLFKQFWDIPNTVRHHEFISFIGRSSLIRDRVNGELLNEDKINKEKLIKFWDWALENVSEPKALSGFGFWIKPDKEILDDNIVVKKIAQTLKKSDGDIDWDYGLLGRLPIFAKKNGNETLEIISSYLLNSKNNLNQNRRALFLDQHEIKEALDIIYKNGSIPIRQKITALINTLIEKGSSMFWNLKEIISEN